MTGRLFPTVAHQATSSVWSAGLDRAAGLEVGEFGTGELGMGDEPVEQMVGIGAFKAFKQKQMPLRESSAGPAPRQGCVTSVPCGGTVRVGRRTAA
ncbi:hypothetical protein SAMN06265355_10251 [Actinomadura mexicana]|uniref:Uncharacterized protein n=1 Tax=Actinomadura mexicana TaxID=134959 RepID=A0A238VMC2_9ACTN|nr:hypothetical protein SAMN06265355_10251 [Actinomadura mexicana]